MDTQSDRRMSAMSLQANIKTPVRVVSTSFVIGRVKPFHAVL